MDKGERIQQMLREGATYDEIVAEVNCSKSSISYHAAKLGITHKRSLYNWEEIQVYHDQGHSISQCVEQFGFSLGTWSWAVKTGRIRVRDWKVPLDQQLVAGRKGHRTIKHRLFREGLLQKKCYECGIAEWRGRPLSLELDHINGDPDDWCIENLRMLCPNCHSQTDTYGSKNKKKQ